ncbi:MAG: hypothetical protein WB421_02820 [Terriglobales bacterium]|jgi:hypothetical protein
MNPLTIARTAFFVLLMAAMAAGGDETSPTVQKGVPDYQKGTIVAKISAGNPAYELRGPGIHVQISNCGDFQAEQAVDYRVEGEKIYIRRENGKEYKCGIEATYSNDADAAAADKAKLTYKQGTIIGWTIRVDTKVGGSVLGGSGSIGSHAAYTWVYELKGSDLIYQITNCGSFQAGHYAPGQVVAYRIDDSDEDDMRVYIHRENGKEYNCQMMGAKTADTSAAPASAKP